MKIYLKDNYYNATKDEYENAINLEFIVQDNCVIDKILRKVLRIEAWLEIVFVNNKIIVLKDA